MATSRRPPGPEVPLGVLALTKTTVSPSGSTSGQYIDRSPSIFGIARGAPPRSGTTYNPPDRVPTTIEPRLPQLTPAGKPSGIVASVVSGPPSAETLMTSLPIVEASHRPSGDNAGF